jgi:hypothetical protein
LIQLIILERVRAQDRVVGDGPADGAMLAARWELDAHRQVRGEEGICDGDEARGLRPAPAALLRAVVLAGCVELGEKDRPRVQQ